MEKNLIDKQKKDAKMLLIFSIISFVASIAFSILFLWLLVNNIIYKHLLPSTDSLSYEELMQEIINSLLIPGIAFFIISFVLFIITLIYRIKLIVILNKNDNSEEKIWIMLIISFFIATFILSLISSILILNKKYEITKLSNNINKEDQDGI